MPLYSRNRRRPVRSPRLLLRNRRRRATACPARPSGWPETTSVPPSVPAVLDGGAVIVGALALVALAWIVATGGPSGRTQTPTASPPATGPTVPFASEPALTKAPPPWEQVDLTGSPSKGAVPSTPRTGDLVAHFTEAQVGWVYVYADGRVIWYQDGDSMFERRLTPDGVELVRSGAVHQGGFLASSRYRRARGRTPRTRSHESRPKRGRASSKWA